MLRFVRRDSVYRKEHNLSGRRHHQFDRILWNEPSIFRGKSKGSVIAVLRICCEHMIIEKIDEPFARKMIFFLDNSKGSVMISKLSAFLDETEGVVGVYETFKEYLKPFMSLDVLIAEAKFHEGLKRILISFPGITLNNDGEPSRLPGAKGVPDSSLEEIRKGLHDLLMRRDLLRKMLNMIGNGKRSIPGSLHELIAICESHKLSILVEDKGEKGKGRRRI